MTIRHSIARLAWELEYFLRRKGPRSIEQLVEICDGYASESALLAVLVTRSQFVLDRDGYWCVRLIG